VIYLESSAFVKLYTDEPGTPEVRAIVKGNADRLLSSVVTYAEVHAAVQTAWRAKRLTTDRLARIRNLFATDWTTITKIEVTQAVLEPVPRLVERYELRGIDCVQLCAALWVRSPEMRFACFDQRLRTAAAAEGLAVVP
jgi:predicted nucleic acid-binding protein